MMRVQRKAVQSCLTNPKLPKSNMTKDEKLALKKLAEDKDIVILPVDNGNATVVLNKEDYNQKMNDLLKDARYKQMKSNPTTKVEKKVATALKEVESRGPVHRGSPWLTTTALHHSCTAYSRFTRMSHPFD